MWEINGMCYHRVTKGDLTVSREENISIPCHKGQLI